MNYPYYNSYFQPQRQELIKVNGIEGAKNYPLSPGSTVAMTIDNVIITVARI